MKKNKKKEKDMPCPEELSGVTDETAAEAAEEMSVEAVDVSNASEESADFFVSDEGAASPEIDTDSRSEDELGEEPEDKVKTKKEKAPRKSGEASPLRLIVTLASICVAIAVLLGGVNLITRVRIAKAAEKEKTNAILAVFEDGDKSKLVETTDSGDEIHLVFKGDGVLGYCVFTTAQGFGGDIKMIVGIDAEYNTLGVKIISMSETPGVGTKTNTLGFLDRFIGKAHSAPIDGVEAIAGATISSEAIKSAVAAAHKIAFDLTAAASAEGATVITKSEADTDKTETPDTSDVPDSTSSDASTSSEVPSSETDSIDPVESETDSDPTEETSDLPFVDIGGGRDYYVYTVGVGTSFDKYVIELTKVTDESGEIIYDPVEVTTESITSTPTEAPIVPPVTDPVTSATTGIASIPIVTTGPESSESPTESVTVTESEPVNPPESSEEVPTEPIPPTPDTTPISPDTSDPNGDKDPSVRPGISIGGRTVGN